MLGRITDIQRFCMHDGPGVRTVVFLKGCPLRCKWCHNPETQKYEHQLYYYQELCCRCQQCYAVCQQGAHVFIDSIHTYDSQKCIACESCLLVCKYMALSKVARDVESSDIIDIITKDVPFYGNKGGVTLSGGEPLSQGDFSYSILYGAKINDINTCVETCGFGDIQTVEKIAEVCDLFLWDIKDTNEIRHKKNTGKDIWMIHKNLKVVDALSKPVVLRCLLIKDINLEENHALNIAKIFNDLHHCKYIELLKYHNIGEAKKQKLGISDFNTFNGIHPTEYDIEVFISWLTWYGVPLEKIKYNYY